MRAAAAILQRERPPQDVAAAPDRFVVLRRAEIAELPRWKRIIIRLLYRKLGLPTTGMWQGMGDYGTEEEALEAAASIPNGQVLPLPNGRLLPLTECRYGKPVAPNSESKAMRKPPHLPRMIAVDERDLEGFKKRTEQVLDNLDTEPVM